jgi:hypothetical protein
MEDALVILVVLAMFAFPYLAPVLLAVVMLAALVVGASRR